LLVENLVEVLVPMSIFSSTRCSTCQTGAKKIWRFKALKLLVQILLQVNWVKLTSLGLMKSRGGEICKISLHIWVPVVLQTDI